MRSSNRQGRGSRSDAGSGRQACSRGRGDRQDWCTADEACAAACLLQVFVRESSMVPVYAVLLFGGGCTLRWITR